MLPDLFRLIGSDRYLTSDDVERACESHPATAAAWDVYHSHFSGFTGATLDPDFQRLRHPATRIGRVRLDPGTTVVVAGTDPSLASQLDDLVRVRTQVRIFTSPRGAAMLAERGIVADLIVIEHQTASAARQAARHSAPGKMQAAPLVAADWRTPASLLTGVPQDSLFVPAPMLSWGLWQATAVAMAVDAKAERVALIGVDAGQAHEAPLKALLELIARVAPFVALDCGSSTTKRGWVSGSTGELSGLKLCGSLDASLWAAPTLDVREQQAQHELAELAPILNRARRLLAVAEDARAAGDRASIAALDAGVDEMMGWRHQPRVRQLIQECLGASFLPRLWRAGLDETHGLTLRRPLQLAMHEITSRANALATAMAEEKAA